MKNEKLRILYFSSGVGIHDFRFLSALSKNENYEVFLLSYVPHQKPLEIENIKTIHFHPKYFTIPLKLLHFKKVLNEIKPHILHAGFVQTYGLFAALSKFHPFLLMPWGTDILIHPYRNFALRYLTKFVLKRADMITCDCETVKNKIVEISGYEEEKIIVFPWGIDLKIFNQGNRNDKIREKLGWENKKILIMTRTFTPIYNIGSFLDAIPEIFVEVPDIRVILIGSGPLENKLKQIVKEKDIDKIVFFAGEIDNKKVSFFLNTADIYISTSLSDGSSLSLLEAMACGLPVVVTDVPANTEWVKDGVNGYIVPKNNKNLLVEKTVNLLKNEVLRNKMSEKNIGIAKERANWEKNFKILEQIYKALSLKV